MLNYFESRQTLLRSARNLALLICLIYSANSFAQSGEPINSNYLFERGVSPRILDIAASDLLQDGSFSQNVIIDVDDGVKTEQFKMVVIYDPTYEDGMDVRVVIDPNTISKSDQKDLVKLVEKSHKFSRMSQNYLVDESTLKRIKDENGEVIFEFYYQKKDIEPYLKSIKRLKGNVIFKNGELDRVVLTNYKPLKDKVEKMERTVYFEKSKETGGYIRTSSEERHEQVKGGKVIVYTMKTLTTDYFTPELQQLSWDGKEGVSPLFKDIPTDTLSVKLGWFLPLLGKPATKLGYSLPRPVGLNIFTHFQDQTMQFTGISIAMNEEDFVSFNDLFDLDKSTIRASGYVAMVKADVWILPFLNIMAIVGNGDNTIDGYWPLDEDVRQGLADWGWLIGLDPEDIPEAIHLQGGLKANMAGLGATLAGGIGDWNASLSYQFMATETVAANTTTLAHVFMPMIGYMTPFGMNLMLGAQGQFYDTKVTGFIDLEDGQRLSYNVDFQPVHWNTIFGIYKGFAKHWEIALQAGVGNRTSVTAVFGYRF